MRIIETFRGSAHRVSIAKLSGGTALATFIGFIVTPIITRLYAPEDYAILAIFTAVTAIAAALVTGGYSAAVVLPRDDLDGDVVARALVRLSIVMAGGLSLVFGVGIAALWISGWDSPLRQLGWWMCALPAVTFAMGANQALLSYVTRVRAYGSAARVAIVSRLTVSGVQLGGGLAGLGTGGLVAGAALGPFVGLGTYSRIFRQHIRGNHYHSRLRPPLSHVAAEFRDFPLKGVWSGLLNALTWNVQIFVLAHFYSSSDVGAYALAFAVVGLPAQIILTGVNPVFYREAASHAQDREARIAWTNQALRHLILVSIPLFIPVMLLAPTIFPLAFGQSWILAGQIAAALVPMFWMRFISTSLSSSLTVHGRQGLLLIWQGCAMFVTVGALSLAGTLQMQVAGAIWIMSFATAAMYAVLLGLSIRVTTEGAKDELE